MKKRLVGGFRSLSSGTLHLRTSTLWQNTCAISALKRTTTFCVVSFCISDLFFTFLPTLSSQVGVSIYFFYETWHVFWRRTMITKLISHPFRVWLTAGVRPAQHNTITMYLKPRKNVDTPLLTANCFVIKMVHSKTELYRKVAGKETGRVCGNHSPSCSDQREFSV